MRILIIGGSDAGISAALRAKEVNPQSRVTVLLRDDYPNFSICGLPFFIGGEVAAWTDLAHRTKDMLDASGIRFLPRHTAMSINTDRHMVLATSESIARVDLPYDRLIIATGAEPICPPIEGRDLPGVFFLRFMDQGLAIADDLKTRRPKTALIIGGGYIGMEMAEALSRRGLAVTLAEMGKVVMPTLDADMAGLLEETLKKNGIRVATGFTATRIEKTGDRLRVTGSRENGETIDDIGMVIVAAGARPAVEPARQAGVAVGDSGAIRVNRKMKTSVPDVFAAGDCAETFHRLTNTNTYMPLGTTAHKQGRTAGENAAGGNAEFAGVLGTQSLKVFDRVAARTGLTHAEAEAAGFSPFSARVQTPDHKAYYPDATPLDIRLTGDRLTQKLLGAQIIGHHGAEISKRIDILASALYAGLGVGEILDLDLSYTPPLSAPWDPVQAAAMEWLATMDSESGRSNRKICKIKILYLDFAPSD
jgi:NADPH-dependent 2,4-dienoyl-CoA reductase/sulfur reductase-like enzyme